MKENKLNMKEVNYKLNCLIKIWPFKMTISDQNKILNMLA